ncbi:MAG: hypothetical protein KAI43_10905 [Candidatus Aureabacteria bacterium]|nr:hypothetical protein [Candidatus Auribacterota bacterium]
MKEKDFKQFLANYLADIVHDLQNYTITIALGKESLWQIMEKYVNNEDDKKNVQNFLRIIGNSNTRIDDIAYFINALRIFFEGKANLHDEELNVAQQTKEVIDQLTYKYAQMKYNIILDSENIDSEEVFLDKDSLRYLLTIFIKILKTDHPDFPIMVKINKKEQHLELELFLKSAETRFLQESFSNDHNSFPDDKLSEEFFVKFIHFFVADTITRSYNGNFAVSRSGNSYNGFKFIFNLKKN